MNIPKAAEESVADTCEMPTQPSLFFLENVSSTDLGPTAVSFQKRLCMPAVPKLINVCAI